ncbi:putative ABC transport system substrate-binding protein [Alkalispirochaeta americana]|uniref:Putative ABC transport system substrate-binding protein n=1 Tax=Alkalispirochaeta americana TaxID=159291 RepID=A0A1N6TZK3_9SPIO|nr:ABC transporter substrate-binding protein [Alkalispirochaeta americana]SIQ58516.1 putative ABC transport system substrate-binding protein [Alkalispirochaeta americana]
MQVMKKFSLLLVLITAGMPLFAGGAPESPREAGMVIGISKIVTHPALDAVEQGILDELRDQGFGDLSFDLQNAQGDVSTAAQIAQKFRADRVAVAVGIATQTAQALANTLTDIPVVFATVTDPLGAGLVPSLEGGGGNVTGTSDMTPVQAQFELIRDVLDAKRVGHVYASGEANAVSLAGKAREAAEFFGMDFIEATVVNSSEVRAATQSILHRVDVIYVSTDNTVVSALPALTEVAAMAGVPVVAADTTSALDGGVLLALGFDYYAFGRVTGGMVAEILQGANPDLMPVRFITDPADLDLLVNLDVARELGLVLPEALIEQASLVIEEGTLR